jgi:hypothetical protein
MVAKFWLTWVFVGFSGVKLAAGVFEGREPGSCSEPGKPIFSAQLLSRNMLINQVNPNNNQFLQGE